MPSENSNELLIGVTAVVRPGLQPGQLHEKAGSAGSDKALVPDKCSDEAHQDRWAFGASCQEACVPAYWNDRDEGYVR